MSYLQLQDPTLERSFRGHKDVITGLAFKPSMSQLASSSMDHSVMIWNFKPQLRAFRFVGHKAPVTSVDFSPTGHLLASSSRDKTVRLWTPNVKGDVTVFKAHTSTVRTVQFSRDGEQLLTASDDKTIKLWSTHRTRFQFTLAGHLNWVRTARFSPDSRLVASGSDDKTVRLWDLASKSCIKTYWDHVGMVSSVAFHPASTDRSIKLFDIRTHKLIQHYGDAHTSPASGLDNSSIGAGGGVNSIAFGGLNGEWLIRLAWTESSRSVWDVKEGHLFYTLHGHKFGATTTAVFSPTGNYFATGGSDSQVMVWKSNFDEIDKMDGPVMAGQDELPVRKIPHSSSAFPHHPHSLHTDPVGHSQVNPKFRPKTPPVVPQVPITTGPNGMTFQNQPSDAGKASAGLGGFGGLASGTFNTLKHSPEIVDVGAPIFADMDFPGDVPQAAPRPVSQHGGMSGPAPSQAGPSAESQGLGSKRVAQLEVRTVSDQISATLQHIVRQIDVLTQTMSILEVRPL
ncbi:WD40-repeat-containing domain protein [Entophlyctis helioformis]|nr:WD40-repeat-containing domain protein [Entophlyctis helioformis]